MKKLFVILLMGLIAYPVACEAGKIKVELKLQQLTSGEKHHFFGYIGQCLTIPWNASGRYVLGLEIEMIDRLPKPEEYATVIIVDTQDDNNIIKLDKCHAWNPQQGTMFYWHPAKPETQFFFNDHSIAKEVHSHTTANHGPWGVKFV